MSAFPTDIIYSKSTRTLTVTYDDGAVITLPAEKLRVNSPSAEVQGHGGPATRQTINGKEFVSILRMEPVGTYAVRLVFDDGHDSGLYTWTYLRDLGTNS